ncbi:hypothetical protein [Legionella feeleii]|uniref:Uncharacterized protein n=1 Tax=Legionella feeleii TaxID=453 RepID=A0A0W0U851_9GAMM|nr:hypothetical protein [Legionella feeleii]KTD04163.1 hypothetical protein Lfee_0251 [Legionella feeleii]SPX60725.1 Uncharacterised protein [Legionella feeleii]
MNELKEVMHNSPREVEVSQRNNHEITSCLFFLALKGILKTNHIVSTLKTTLTKVIMNTLKNNPSLRDLIIWNFVKLPLAQYMLKEATTHIESANYEALTRFPEEIKVWASMQVQRDLDERKWLEPKRKSQQFAVEAKKEITAERNAIILQFASDIGLENTILTRVDLYDEIRTRILKSKDLNILETFTNSNGGQFIPTVRAIRAILSKKIQ